MAAEFPCRSRGRCHLNAQALAAGDPRWSRYLGPLYRARGDTAKAAAFPANTAAAVRRRPRADLAGRPSAIKAVLTTPLRRFRKHSRCSRVSSLHEWASAAPPLPAATTQGCRAVRGRPGIDRVPLSCITRWHWPIVVSARWTKPKCTCVSGEIEIGPPDPLMRDLAESLHSASMFEARGDRALAAGDFSSALRRAFQRGVELAPDNLSDQAQDGHSAIPDGRRPRRSAPVPRSPAPFTRLCGRPLQSRRPASIERSTRL